MTKAELIDMVTEHVGDVSKAKVGEVYAAIFATIAKGLEVEGRYSVSDFGTFDVKERAARTGATPPRAPPSKSPRRRRWASSQPPR